MKGIKNMKNKNKNICDLLFKTFSTVARTSF